MSPLSPKKFVNKWSKVRLKEISAAQSHLNDVCSLVGHPAPVEADPKGEFFTFEEPTKKVGGKSGRADVWFKDKFIWEYKGYHANLDKAYEQLLLYRESLGNPPLLITSDMHRVIIHTNFTNTVKQIHTIELEDILKKESLDLIRSAFYEPESLRPEETQKQVTEATAESFVAVARTLQSWARAEKREQDPEKLAHFIIQLLFILFAEDMKLLPDDVFTKLVSHKEGDIKGFVNNLKRLFTAMRDGGAFGYYSIPHFDGTLFDNGFIPDLPGDIVQALQRACRQDWSSIDPSIFGTLFERVIDEAKRAKLGAHYTGIDDIRLVVEPVLMRPLRAKWLTIKRQAEQFLNKGQKAKANNLLKRFAKEVASIGVLDPACGSGNFLYVALRQLLDLQKEVIVFAGRNGLSDIPLTVSPEQLFGIEIDLYAHELAQITVWIGYIQWRFENGFSKISEPILRPLRQIECKDAILTYDNDGNPIEPDWPEADVIISNPPFLGSRKMRPVLGDRYCGSLLKAYARRIEGLPDLVCYWFEKTRSLITKGKIGRAGLLATQAIRGGTNRQVLDRIKETGNIFMAWSDKDWLLDGSKVHVSIVGFDDGKEKETYLDGEPVSEINSDLTASIDLSSAGRLEENGNLSFQGVVLRGAFNINSRQAEEMLKARDNPNNRSNRDVIKPRRTGKDVTRGAKDEYVIDFGEDMPIAKAKQYARPFKYLKEKVFPERQKARQTSAREKWWIHWNPRTQMRRALKGLKRYIATPRVAKHRVFVWLDSSIMPDAQLVVFARSDDYFLGVLHSRPHELWARRKGTQLRDATSGFRYTSKTAFETFPMPWPPGKEPKDNKHVAAIARAARELIKFRQAWLYPEGAGVTVSIKKRTLTNLYNALTYYREYVKGKQRDPRQWEKDMRDIISLSEIEELSHIHDELNRAVLNAYGLPYSSTDEQILKFLLALNQERMGRNTE